MTDTATANLTESAQNIVDWMIEDGAIELCWNYDASEGECDFTFWGVEFIVFHEEIERGTWRTGVQVNGVEIDFDRTKLVQWASFAQSAAFESKAPELLIDAAI